MGAGISPSELTRLLGKVLLHDKCADEHILWEDVEDH
jgi:hypothetical protein